MRKILLVGSRPNVLPIFEPKLAPFGISEVVHVDTARSFSKVDDDFDGVILVHNNADASLCGFAEGVSGHYDIPLCRVRHQWGKALPVLLAQGFLPPSAAGLIPSSPDPRAILELGADHLVEERRKGGRGDLTFKGTLQACRRAFGEDFILTGPIFEQMREEAFAYALPQPAPAPVEEPPSAPTQTDEDDLLECALLVLDDTPEMVLDQEALRKAATSLRAADTLPSSVTDKVIRSAVKGRRRLWAEDKAVRLAAQTAWMRNRISECWTRNRSAPGNASTLRTSQAIFGHQINWSLVKDLRGEVLGSWAAGTTLGIHQAYTEYVSLMGKRGLTPGDRPAFDLLLDECKILCFRSGRPGSKWDTTAEAIAAYVELLPDRPLTLDPTPKPQETPVSDNPVDLSQVLEGLSLIQSRLTEYTRTPEDTARFDELVSKAMAQTQLPTVKLDQVLEGITALTSNLEAASRSPAASRQFEELVLKAEAKHQAQLQGQIEQMGQALRSLQKEVQALNVPPTLPPPSNDVVLDEIVLGAGSRTVLMAGSSVTLQKARVLGDASLANLEQAPADGVYKGPVHVRVTEICLSPGARLLAEPGVVLTVERITWAP